MWTMVSRMFSAVLFASFFSVAYASNVYVEPSQVLIDQRINVGAGRISYYELNLQADTTLVTKFTVSGGLNKKVNVWLLDMDNFQKFMANQRFSYYKGTSGVVKGVANYSFDIPQTNIYYLVVDNTGALFLKRNVYLYAYQLFKNDNLPGKRREREALEKLYSGLKQLFVFQDFRIFIRHCGFENAFSSPDITMCKELENSLDRQGLQDVWLYVFYHELGHTLLKLWGYPTWDNEDVADEFATVLAVLSKSNDSALKAAKWWAQQASEKEAVAKLWIDDRHTISPQRARNIIRWLNSSGDLMYRWQKIFVPNMQTALLQKMVTSNESWIDRELVRSELAKRAALSGKTRQSNLDSTTYYKHFGDYLALRGSHH